MKGFKTVAFNFAMLLLASPDILAMIPPKAAMYIIPLGNIILRALTTTPIGKKE